MIVTNNRSSLNELVFQPHPFLKTGMLQTIVGNVFETSVMLSDTQTMAVKLEDDDQIMLFVNAPQHETNNTPTVVLVHGLGGSGQSGYQVRLARKLVQKGFRVVRFNHRGACDQAQMLARKIYHSGCRNDIKAGLKFCQNNWPNAPLLAIGFSLSANMLLALLGMDTRMAIDIPNLIAALAIAPPIDLELCSLALDRVSNAIIDRYYVKKMRKLVRQKARVFSDFKNYSFPKRMSLRQFDELFTAKVAGFKNRDEYYRQCSSKDLLANINIPTTILTSDDDPIIPKESFIAVKFSKFVTPILQRGGGHMGFISHKPTSFGDRRWLDEAVTCWVETVRLN